MALYLPSPYMPSRNGQAQFNLFYFSVCNLDLSLSFRNISALSHFLKNSLAILILLFLNINQLDALNFIISLFQASTCFEHMCSSSGGQKLYYMVSGITTPIGVMIPETV